MADSQGVVVIRKESWEVAYLLPQRSLVVRQFGKQQRVFKCWKSAADTWTLAHDDSSNARHYDRFKSLGEAAGFVLGMVLDTVRKGKGEQW